MKRTLIFLLLLVFTSALPSAAAEGPLVQGRILAPGGEPFPGVEIELIPQPLAQQVAERQLAGKLEEKAVVRTRTGEDGRFEVVSPEVGRYKLLVRHRDHLPLVFYLEPLLLPLEVPTIELVARRDQELQVLDGEGRPLAGLLVAARGWSSYWSAARRQGWSPQTRWATTDERGRASIVAHDGEEVSIAAVSGDRFLHHKFKPQREGLTVSLAKMSPARVLDADGRPARGISGAMRWPFLAFGTTDQRGEILIPARDENEVSLRFVDGAIVYERVRLEESEEGPPIFHLPEVIELHGQVVEAETGTPLAGAWVWIPNRWFERTDRSGSFALRLPFYGKLAGFRAAAPGYLERAVELDAARPAGQDLTLVLRPARTLKGRVVDLDGAPIAEAGIKVDIDWNLSPGRQSSTFAAWRSVSLKTGADGRFEIPTLDRRAGYRLWVDRRGYARATLSVPPAAGRADDLEIVLEPGLLASGLVLDELERPLAGVEVALLPKPDGRASFITEPLRQKTDAEGRFTFDQGAPGRYMLVAWKEGYSELRVPGIELLAAEESDLGTVFLDRAVTLHGRVVDRDDRPIEGVEVRVHDQGGRDGMSMHRDRANRTSATTTADGRFEIDGLSRHRRFSLFAQHPEYQHLNLREVPLDGEPLRVVLERGVALRGRVVDRTGAAAASVMISMLRGGNLDRVSSDEEGRFAFSAQPPGTVTLSARGAAGVAEPRAVELSLDPPSEDVRLVLAPAALLRGLLTSPDALPVADAQITLTRRRLSTARPSRGQREAQSALSEGDGSFLITGLGGGRYRLRAEHGDFRPLERYIEIRPGSEVSITLAFEERLEREKWQLQGTILGEGGPLEGATVWLEPARATGRGHVQTVSMADGSFTLSAPDRGWFTVAAEHSDYAMARSDPVEIGDGPRAELVLQLSRGATVSGQIHGIEFDRLADLQIAAHGEGGGRVGSVQYDGSYRITHLAPGRWMVMAMLQSPFRSVQEEVEIVSPDDDHAVDLDFARGFEIQGLVRRNGEPLRQGQVLISCSEGVHFSGVAPLRASGEFIITGVPAGRCRLNLYDSRRKVHLQRALEVDGDDQVLIEFSTGSVDGQVLRADDGGAVSGALIWLRASGSSGVKQSAISGADGRFGLVDVPEGSWKLMVDADGYQLFEETVEVASSGLATQVLLRPAAEPAVIYLRTASGRATHAVGVEIINADGAKRFEFHEPELDGKILLTSVAPGSYLLSFQSAEGTAVGIELTVPGEPLQVMLQPVEAPASEP